MAYRPEWDEKRKGGGGRLGGLGDWFRGLSALGMIATVTIAVFVVQVMVVKSQGADIVSQWLGLRAWWPDQTTLQTLPDGTVLVEEGGGLSFNWLFPFQIFTYMLVHDTGGLMHLGWNLLLAYIYGRELEASMGRAGLLRLFITGGVVGGVAVWVSGLLGGSWVPTIGASGAVYALMLLFTLKYPRRVFIMLPIPIPMPVWIITAFKVLGDLNGLVTGATGVAFLAHLGGAFVGYLWWKRGDVVVQVDTARRRVKAEKKTAQDSGDRREMDRILAKIQAEGLGSLSKAEREFLNRRSRELRNDRS